MKTTTWGKKQFVRHKVLGFLPTGKIQETKTQAKILVMNCLQMVCFPHCEMSLIISGQSCHENVTDSSFTAVIIDDIIFIRTQKYNDGVGIK